MHQILSYEGKTDLRDHLDAVNDQMGLLQVNDLAKCHYFGVTLTQVAKKWFHKPPTNSIWSWAQLLNEFVRQFQAIRIYSKPGNSLTNIKQCEGKTLKSYLKWFSNEATRVHSTPEGGVLFTVIGGVCPKTKLWNDL